MQKILANQIYKTLQIRHLTDSSFILRFERNGLQFSPGQYLNIGPGNDIEKRDYSIYSPVNADYLEVLIKEVDNGTVSKSLKHCRQGDLLEVSGPFGFFTVPKDQVQTSRFLFIASGTGVSPFHSMILSNPAMDYHLIHGVKYGNEAYGAEDIDLQKLTLCTSRDQTGNFHGRLTSYLSTLEPDKDTLCYLCGNVNMIYDAVDILKEKGIPSSQIHTEVYF